ncbi:MAG TPA: phosphotransferase [Longimicrobium sp.]|nr:phosphotransferase [Longimicrobium sp.]
MMNDEHAAAAERLRAVLPALGIDLLEPLGEGDFCLGFAADGDRVVRVARHEVAARALQREACVMERIAGALPLAVPRPRFHHLPDAPPFSVHARVPGVELTDERWLALPDPLQAEAARDVAGFLAALHDLPLDAAVACGIQTTDHAAEARALIERFRADLMSHLPADAAARVEGAYASYLAGGERWAYRPAVLHGDFGPDHVMHDAETGRVTGVIDFGDLMIGDPARDFIYVHEDYGPEILARILPLYGRESAGAMLPRVRFHHLHSMIEWALRMRVEGSRDDLTEALEEIARESEYWVGGG